MANPLCGARLTPECRQNLQVFIVGPDATIDTVPSSKWLAAKTANWTSFRTHLRINVRREEALGIISSPGMLLVLCSGIDNMPYVVTEAAVRSPWTSPGLLLLYPNILECCPCMLYVNILQMQWGA